jgi:hypothetical protein
MKAYFSIYGHRLLCQVLANHGAGTYDVEVIEPGRWRGRCYRVTGLPLVIG